MNGDKENKKTVDNNLKTVKEVLSNDDDGLTARCPTFRRREGFDLWQKDENLKKKKCKIKKTIYVSCEKVVRGNAMHRQSPSHFLREVGNLPRNCTVW